MTKKVTKRPIIGRPSKYDASKNKEVIELMSQGASLKEVAGMLDISRETVYEWCKVHKDFADTIARGVLLSEIWWERLGRTNLENKDFNDRLYNINMQNRFAWSLKQKSDVKVEDTSKQEKASEALAKLSKEQLLVLNEAFESEGE